MKKKPASSTQVRIYQDLVAESEKLRNEIGIRQSFSSFVNDMLAAGIAHTWHIRGIVKDANNKSSK